MCTDPPGSSGSCSSFCSSRRTEECSPRPCAVLFPIECPLEEHSSGARRAVVIGSAPGVTVQDEHLPAARGRSPQEDRSVLAQDAVLYLRLQGRATPVLISSTLRQLLNPSRSRFRQVGIAHQGPGSTRDTALQSCGKVGPAFGHEMNGGTARCPATYKRADGAPKIGRGCMEIRTAAGPSQCRAVRIQRRPEHHLIASAAFHVVCPPPCPRQAW